MRKDGEIRHLLVSRKEVTWNGSTQFQIVYQDITERKRVEERLKKSEALLAEAQSIAHIGNWELNLVSNVLTWSDEIYRMFGLEPQQFGANYEAFLDNIHPDDKEMVNQAYSESVRNRTPYCITHRLLLKDGTIKYVEERCTTLYNADGQPFRSIGIVQDITEREKMQEQLMAQDRLASIGQLVSGVAHEINNPLTSVIGFSDLLLQRDLPDDIKGDLTIINDEARRTSRIVKNLLTFARKQPEEKTEIQVNEHIQGVLALRNHEQSVNNIKVNTHFAPNLPQIIGNSSQLQQVFFNVIVNAEQAMLEAHSRGVITVTTERLGGVVKVRLADDGPGISPENMKKLFTPFFTTKAVGKGTGLGLSICHGIVTEHGGRIYAESELEKGATFIVELPIKEAPTDRNVA